MGQGSGLYLEATGEAAVFQKTVDYPDEYHHGFHVNLDDGSWETVSREQVREWS